MYYHIYILYHVYIFHFYLSIMFKWINHIKYICLSVCYILNLFYYTTLKWNKMLKLYSHNIKRKLLNSAENAHFEFLANTFRTCKISRIFLDKQYTYKQYTGVYVHCSTSPQTKIVNCLCTLFVIFFFVLIHRGKNDKRVPTAHVTM